MIEKLLAERQQLTKRLAWLGLRSTGSDRIENRIREIDGYIDGHNSRLRAVSDLYGCVESQVE